MCVYVAYMKTMNKKGTQWNTRKIGYVWKKVKGMSKKRRKLNGDPHTIL